MIYRVSGTGGFEFVRVSALRAAQLMRGSTPRVPVGHRPVITAQREVVEGKVCALPRLSRSVLPIAD
jgi:DNA-directed RNA polymerase subunit K/omega